MVQFTAPFLIFLFTISKFPKGTFYGLSSSPLSKEMKSRHCGLDPQSQGLVNAIPYQVWGDILEIRVQ